MAELLVELLSEEIPARMQARAADDLKRLIDGKLQSAGLAASRSEAHVTPRRLVYVADGVPTRQPDLKEERRGPRADAPEKAIRGFLGSVGLALEQCEKRDTGKGVFLFAVIERPGRDAVEVLPDVIVETIREVPWPKSMTWGTGRVRWVRPLHSILALFAGRPLAGSLELGDGGGVAFGATTRRHRFLAPEPVTVAGFADYRDKLRAGHVVLDRAERRRMIAERAAELAAAEGLRVRPDEGLLEEVSGLVEWPVPLLGRIDDAFMDVPPEVLTTAMRTHQRYFALERADGSLAPRFVVVANVPATDGGRAIVAGNERVLRARLSDARFFWDQDRKVRLESRLDALRDRVFHAKLGSVHDKVERLQGLAASLAGHIGGCDAALARRAARLAKADLSSGMVGEFPELQGVMGRYYARHDGEDAAVAEAIAEHYSPLGPSDRCPTAPVSVAVALADKIDTLVGFFAIDERPTGSRDPFALRRAALGVIRLVVENRLRLPLLEAFGAAAAEYSNNLGRQLSETSAPFDSPEVRRSLLEFIADRLKVHLREQGIRHDLIAAVFALGDFGRHEDDLVRLLARVDALSRLLGTEAGTNLLTGYRRAANIVRIEEKKDGRRYGHDVSPAHLHQAEEKALYGALAEVSEVLESRIASDDFSGAMDELAKLRQPIDSFFDKVTVNVAEDEALRENRLKFMAHIVGTMNQVADFAKIEG